MHGAEVESVDALANVYENCAVSRLCNNKAGLDQQ